MLEDYNKRDKNHLFELIRRRSKETPNFALLIGAGASVTSGIKTSKEMIDEWCRQLHLQEDTDSSMEEWSKKQEWYDNDDEYSILFEKVCDQRSQRRIYIEECVRKAKPSWGYIYLANIIDKDYFNVIFTSNFDDLLNEACFLYTDSKPVVCAQDSSVIDVRVTSARPKIIKLHGDFLYDDIKNTVRETESLEKNMRDKFKQFANEYGLVVIGYGGYDRSIMDILYSVLRTEGTFPHGIYWCIRDKNKISKKLQRLMRQENIYWVEIDGFDEFMAELHHKLGLLLPETVRNPYRATTSRLNKFILPMKEVKHPLIKKDILNLESQVKKFEKIVSEGGEEGEVDKYQPYSFLGSSEFVKGNYEDALFYCKKALSQDPKNRSIMSVIFYSYIGTENFEKAKEISEKIIENNPENHEGYIKKSIVLTFSGKINESLETINQMLNQTNNKTSVKDLLTCRSNNYVLIGEFKKALSDAENSLKIDPHDYTALNNKCLALKKLGKKTQAKKIIQDELSNYDNSYLQACAYAIINDKTNMLKKLKESIEVNDIHRIFAKFDPEFEEYKNDSEFKEIIKSVKNVKNRK